jgi:arabinofuranosyltransferase
MIYLKFALFIIPTLVLIVIYFPTNHFFANQYDDSYITYRYAVNLAEGHGIVFNIGERTDAASSFLYTVVLSIGHIMGMRNLELLSGMLGLISLGLICVLVFLIAERLTQNKVISSFVALACGLNGFLTGWALSGMETLPWTLAVVFTIYLLIIDARPLIISLAIASAALMRFEGIFLIIPFFWILIRKREKITNYIPLFIVISLFCIFYIIKYAYYGVWISHAFKMKELGGLGGYYSANPREVIQMWLTFGSVPLILGIASLCRARYHPILVWLGISFLAILIGPKSDWSRYSVHLLPILYAFSAATIVSLLKYKLGSRYKRVAILGFTTVLLFAEAIQSVRGGKFGYQRMIELAPHQICRKQIGDYIAQNISKEAYIASGDIGAIAYRAINHSFVDIAGLTSSDVLSEYASGNTAASVFEKKGVRFLADTFVKDQQNFDAPPPSQPLPNHSSYYSQRITEVLLVCSAGEYDFKLVRLN